jgi:hypothetical protein
MRVAVHGFLSSAMLVALGITLTPTANAQCPSGGAPAGCAPTGAIFNLATSDPGLISSTESLFTTSFVADNTSEYVSFAFREQPNYWSFDDASVVLNGTTTNLLADFNFAAATDGQNCNDGGNGLGCPPGWGAWIQSVDTSAIGQIATQGNPYGCGSDVPTQGGGNFWCDGSVQGYDAIYQQLTGLVVGDTYNVSWYLGHDDGGAPSGDPTDSINMLVYAGDSLPVGSIPIGTAPEPATLGLLGLGLVSFGLVARKRRKQ